MDVGCYALVFKILFELVAKFAKYGVLMPYADASIWGERFCYEGIYDIFIIQSRGMLASAAYGVEVVEHHGEHTRVELVDAAVVAAMDVVISAVAAVIGKCPYGLGELPVIGCHGTGVAESAGVFRRIET